MSCPLPAAARHSTPLQKEHTFASRARPTTRRTITKRPGHGPTDRRQAMDTTKRIAEYVTATDIEDFPARCHCGGQGRHHGLSGVYAGRLPGSLGGYSRPLRCRRERRPPPPAWWAGASGPRRPTPPWSTAPWPTPWTTTTSPRLPRRTPPPFCCRRHWPWPRSPALPAGTCCWAI